MELCPLCNHEILPYLKTGELKSIKGKIRFGTAKNEFGEDFLVSYQLLYCVKCKIVWWQEIDQIKFMDLNKTRESEKEKRKKQILGGK